MHTVGMAVGVATPSERMRAELLLAAMACRWDALF